MEWKTLFAHRDPRRARRVLPALLAVSLLAGCAAATPQNRFDPYEAANRKVHALTTWLTAPPCNRWRAAIAP